MTNTKDTAAPGFEQSLVEEEQVFSARVSRELALLGMGAEFPFLLYHVFYGSGPVALILVSVILCQLVIFRLARDPRHGPAGAHVLAVFHTSAAAAAANLLGFTSSYWIFATTVANFYILPLRSALIANGLSLLLVLPLLAVDQEAGARFLVGLLLVNLFGLVFSRRTSQQRAALQQLLFLDPLTGIGNRRALDEALESAAELFNRHQAPVSLLIFDLDFFKRVNDEHGHKVGDDVLRRAVGAIRERLRANDSLYRYGGEEFVVLASNTDLDGALVLAEDLRRVVEKSRMPGELKLTTSVGAASLQKGEKTEQWFLRADRNLYQAKNRGRNRVCV